MNAKKNISSLVLKAFYELLNGNTSVPVYRSDAPAGYDGDYILLRVESDTDTSNNHRHVHNPVVITEVVTKHGIIIDDNRAPSIDSEIAELLFTRTSQHNLPAQDGIYITGVRRVNATYLNEDDGTNRYHTIATRNVCRVAQEQLTT